MVCRSTMIKEDIVNVGRCSEQFAKYLQRVLMTGVGIALLVVLTNLTAQAQTTEQRLEVLENAISKLGDELPSWVKRFSFKGDLRLRYQYEETTGRTERHRGILRYRLGVSVKVTEQIQAVFGLASGGDDPRSTNQTFQDTFSSKGIQLDLAYGEYQPFKGFKLIGGKFKNPLWKPSDLLWDSDINPEGGAIDVDLNSKLAGSSPVT